MTQRMTQEQALQEAVRTGCSGRATATLKRMLTAHGTRRARARARAAAARATLAALKAGSGEWRQETRP